MDGRYMVEVNGLSVEASWADVYEFFLNCGNIDKLEITRIGAEISVAHVTFEEAYSVKIALFLSGSKIADQEVTVSSCGTHYVDSSPYLLDIEELENGSESHAVRSDQFNVTPGKAVTVVQEVVQNMVIKGYDLSKDALSKAKAFDESHKVSYSAASKIAELSRRIGLTDKISSGVQAAKYVDEKYHVVETSKSVASYTGKTALAAGSAIVNSSYFGKGALWVSGVLDRGAKAAAELGNRRSKNNETS